jgi:hypothetical protein
VEQLQEILSHFLRPAVRALLLLLLLALALAVAGWLRARLWWLL